MVPIFKSVRERSKTKNYCPVNLLSVVSRIFEKLVNNRLIDHLKKCGEFKQPSMETIPFHRKMKIPFSLNIVIFEKNSIIKF